MARIVVNATMIRFPMGGMNQWILTWLVGLCRHGHEVYLVESSDWENACFDLKRGIMTDDCSYGISVVRPLLARYGLGDNWCFIDHAGVHHGLSKARVDELFRSADAFLDFEWGSFFERAADIPLRIFLDGEPGWFQIKLLKTIDAGGEIRDYNLFFTSGMNVGTAEGSAPTAGIDWIPTFNPVLMDHEPPDSSAHNGRFTTVIDWQSNRPVEFKGRTYGQKDIEFEKFMELPRLLEGEIEVAVSGPAAPKDRLRECGWLVRPANEVARSIDSYRSYIAGSMGEFTVAKNAFVQTGCGWLGDREGVYLSYGRPVVVQETGFSRHIPCGQGLFAVNNLEEAAAAHAEIRADYRRHSRAARELAEEYLAVATVVGAFLRKAGLQ